jgi:hypothetical protein
VSSLGLSWFRTLLDASFQLLMAAAPDYGGP